MPHRTAHALAARRWTLALVAVVLAAGLLRTLAALCDLWLDEIWSLQTALRLSHPLLAPTVLHDNNHILNTVWLAMLGADRPELLYRLPNVLAGAAAVAIAAAIVGPADRTAQLITVLLLATSQLLVTHSSEARGYGPMIACLLLSLLALQRQLDGAGGRWAAPLFWTATLLAAFAHLSAALGYAALGLYWLARRLRDGPRSELLAEGVRLHLVPALGLLALYVLFVARMEIGGGHFMTPGQVALATAAMTLGLGEAMPGAVLPMALVSGVAMLALYELWRARDLRWVLFTAGIVLPPIALVASGIRHASHRYVLLSVTFFLLLLGTVSGRWIARAGAARAGCLALLCLLIALNVLGDVELIRLGRGSYRAALALMLGQPGSGQIVVTSDHDFRNPLILEHYARMHPDGGRLRYVSAAQLQEQDAQWLILHRVAGEPDVPPDHIAVRGQLYDKQLALPCAITAGMSWYLFSRTPAHSAAVQGSARPTL